MRRALLAFALLSVLPASASASSAAMLPRVGGSGVGPEAREEARALLRASLTNEGWTVYAAEEVSTALPPALGACGPEDACAWELRAMLGADVAVGLRLWGTEERVERLAVIVTGVRGVGHRTLAEVTEEAPIEIALPEAVRTALSTWSTGALSPTAAPPRGESVDPAPANHLEGSALNWFLGGLLVLGSAPMLGYGINTMVRDGDCIEGSPELCTRRVRFEEGAAIFTALGAAVLIGGVVVLAVQPIRVAVTASESSAGLRVEGRF